MTTFWKLVNAHRKTITAVAGLVLSTLTRVYPQATWLPIVVALATALGVYSIPNGPMPGKPAPKPKP